MFTSASRHGGNSSPALLLFWCLLLAQLPIAACN